MNCQPLANRRQHHSDDGHDDQFFPLTQRRLEQHIVYTRQLRDITKDSSPQDHISGHLPSLPSTSQQELKPVSVVAPQVTHSAGGGSTKGDRRQYTLSSIGSLQSRSRSPIVGPSADLYQQQAPLHWPLQYILKDMARSNLDRTQSQQDLTERGNLSNGNNNPFELAAPVSSGELFMRQTDNSHVAPVHLISTASFERRRSVYELAAESGSLPANLRTQTDTSPAAGGHGGPNVSTLEVDPLASLDEILATIEAGQGSRPSDRSSWPDDNIIPVREANIELSELPSSSSINPQPSQLLRRSSPQSGGNAKQSLSSSNSSSSSSETNLAEALHQQHQQLVARRRSRDANVRRSEIANGFEVAWLDFTYLVEPSILEDPRWGRVNTLFHKERRTILKGLSGGFKSGQMVALMGPSGAGKTCLLESISGVRTTGIGGRMCLRGRKRAQLVIVPQYDNFMPQFSVEEIIIYGSRMKNPPSTNHRKVANTVIEQLGLQACRHNNIQRCSGGQRKRVAIAQELVSKPNILILDEPTSGLDSSCCYHTMKVLRDVLDKSVTMDEPMAIVSTIHQPSAKVFKMFDLVYVLGKTGYMAYSGPPDELLPTISDVTGLECPKYSNPSDFMIELVAYDYGEEPVELLVEFERQKAAQYVCDFEKRAGLKPGSSQQQKRSNDSSLRPSRRKQQFRTKHPQAKLEIEHESSLIIQPPLGGGTLLNGSLESSVLSLSIGRLMPSKSDTHLNLAQTSRLDQIQQRLKATDLLNGVAHVIYKNNVTLSLRKATNNDQRRHPFLWHTWVHIHRSFLQAIRDPILNNMRILIHLGFASLLVLLYGKKSGEARGCPPVLGLPQEIVDPHQESMIDLADNVGYLFMCIMMITYVSLMSTVLTFPIDIKTVGKEYKNGWYGTVTYFLGKTIADMPFIIIYPVVYCLITWYMTNQAQDHYWRHLSFTGLIIMNAMNSQSFGLILGALFVNSVTAATFLGPVITIPWYLFTGFTKRVYRLREPFKTTSKFLFTRYVFEGILDTVYGHQRCNCSQFLQEYHELRLEEASRLGQLVSVETLSSLDYYDGIDTVAQGAATSNESSSSSGGSSNWFERTMSAASTVFADGEDLNLGALMDSNTKASSMFSFGLDFEPTCPGDYETYVAQDFRLGDKAAQKAFVIVFGMLWVIRVVTFLLVSWKIKTRQL